jgi:hypothetical protein
MLLLAFTVIRIVDHGYFGVVAALSNLRRSIEIAAS